MDSKSPKLFLYSISLPFAWFSLSYLFLITAPNIKMGLAGVFIAVNLSTLFTCWLFSKSFNRHFKKFEKLRITIYLISWMLVIRLLSIYGISESLSVKEMIYSVVVILAIDTLFIAASVFSLSDRFNSFWQRKIKVENA